MALTITTDINTLAKRLTDGLVDALRARILIELQAIAKPMLSQIAEDMAQQIHGHVHAIDSFGTEPVKVTLVLDGIANAIEAVKPVKRGR